MTWLIINTLKDDNGISHLVISKLLLKAEVEILLKQRKKMTKQIKHTQKICLTFSRLATSEKMYVVKYIGNLKIKQAGDS